MSRDLTESIRSVLRGVGFFAAGKVVSNVLRFGVNLVLTRHLGTSLYGVYTYGNLLVLMSERVTKLGADRAFLRFLPAYSSDQPRRNRVFTLGMASAIVANCLVAAVLFVVAPVVTAVTLDHPLQTATIRLFAIALPFRALTKIVVHALRALELPGYQTLVKQVLVPGVRLGAVGLAFVTGLVFLETVTAVVAAVILSFLAGAIVLALRTDLRPEFGGHSREELFEFYNYSIPVVFSSASSFLVKRIDLLMIGFFLAGSAVGVYNVAVIISGVLTLPLAGINQIFPSVAAGLYSDREMGQLARVHQVFTRWGVAVGILMAVGIFAYRSDILALFGEDFPAAAPVLGVLVLAQLANVAAGPSGFLLLMTDHQYLSVVNQFVLGTINVVLNYVLILQYGVFGAAVATSAAFATLNGLRILEVWYFEGIVPYSRSTLKPIVAGGVTGITLLALRGAVGGYTGMVIGAVVGTAVYAVTMYFLGIEEDDRELARSILG